METQADTPKKERFQVVYRPIFGGEIIRTFDTRAGAESWCRRIGNPSLIPWIKRVPA